MLSAKSKYRSDWMHMAAIKTTIINRTTTPPPLHTPPSIKIHASNFGSLSGKQTAFTRTLFIIGQPDD